MWRKWLVCSRYSVSKYLVPLCNRTAARGFFCYRVKSLGGPWGKVCGKITFLILIGNGRKGGMTVFSCKDNRKLSLFCPSLKPLFAYARGMESQRHGPRRGFHWASRPWRMDSGEPWTYSCLQLMRQSSNSNSLAFIFVLIRKIYFLKIYFYWTPSA